MSQLKKCSDELTTCVEALTGKYDARHVLAALLARASNLSAAVVAAGVDATFVQDLWVSSAEHAAKPPKKKPAVVYYDSASGRHLGRKQ